MKWLTTVVGCVVGLLLITAVLVPVIGSYSSGFTEEKVGYNDGFQRYSKVDSFEMVRVSSGYVTLDGVDYSEIANLDKMVNATVPAVSVVLEKAVINFYNKSSPAVLYTDGTEIKTNGPKSITFSDGTLTTQNFDGTIGATITGISYAYVPSLDGEYMAVDINDNEAYFEPESTIVQWSGASGVNFGVVSGTASDRVTGVGVFNGVVTDNYGSLTTDSVKVGDTTLGTILGSTPSFVLVPYAYNYSESEDNTLYTLLEVIPIIMILGVVLTMGGMVVLRRF